MDQVIHLIYIYNVDYNINGILVYLLLLNPRFHQVAYLKSVTTSYNAFGAFLSQNSFENILFGLHSYKLHQNLGIILWIL